MLALVTGANGFVGSNVTRELLNNGYTVRVLHRAKSNLSAIADCDVDKRVGDITDRASLRDALSGCELVFHIAAAFRDARLSDDDYFRVNLEGTKLLFEEAKAAGVRKIVYCSTTGVLGDIKNPPGNEETEYAPLDVYQESKTEAEKYVLSAFRSGFIDGCVIRPAMIWGPGDTRILKLFKGIAGRTMPIIGDGETWTHWILVSDLARAFRLGAEVKASTGQIYIIAGKTPVRMKEIYHIIAEAFGVTLLPFKIPALPLQLLGTVVETLCRPLGINPPIFRRRVDFYVKSRCFDTAKAGKELGFEASRSIEQEVKLIADWYREKGWVG